MTQLVISASRRTDIPAFYMPWFMRAIDWGHFEVINPYNQKAFQIPASPDQVHTIVFWSKNFAPFLDAGYGDKLVQKGYHLFFNFTINTPHGLLEPNLPGLQDRLNQLERLCRTYGPDAIQWRFDPICVFKDAAGRCADNLSRFHDIARFAADLGISVCITSFVDHYQKVRTRMKKYSDIELLDPPLQEKRLLITKLAEDLWKKGIHLQICCEKELLDALPADAPIQAASCIPSQRIIDLYGPGISTAKDKGQRQSAGCRCGVSKDIGSYKLHPCHHNCLYCYANPTVDHSKLPPSKARSTP